MSERLIVQFDGYKNQRKPVLHNYTFN